jgi:uncharacterized iron-regulated membrane protein
VLLAVTGAYLWLPRRWSGAAIRSTLLFRKGLRGKARDFTWHNMIGACSVLPLLLITSTEVVISYPWANALLFRLAGSEAPTRPGGGRPPGGGPQRMPEAPPVRAADLDRAVAVAGAQVPDWRSMSLRLPAPDEMAVVVNVDTGTGGQVAKRTELVVDTRAGQVVRMTRSADNDLGRRLRGLARFIHTGEEGGFLGQLIAALASAGACVLVWTGLSLALRRLRAARRRDVGDPQPSGDLQQEAPS